MHGNNTPTRTGFKYQCDVSWLAKLLKTESLNLKSQDWPSSLTEMGEGRKQERMLSREVRGEGLRGSIERPDAAEKLSPRRTGE